MKNIIDYIKKEYFDELYIEAMKDFFGDELPDYVLESAENNEYTDYILETLKSYNVDIYDANDMVYKDNHGKLYHFSTGKYAGEIERTGLRCRSAKYRYYPERIYCYALDKSFEKLDDLYNKVMTVINPFDAKKYGVYVYHIDLNKLTKDNYINFYSDDLMRDKSAVYTYNAIPASCIKLIKKFEYPIK